MGGHMLPLAQSFIAGVCPAQSIPSPEGDGQGISQCLRDLVNSMEMNVELRGILPNDRVTASDLFHPRVRRSSLAKESVQHLDIVSCWKGMSYSIASELAAWNRLFRDALASEVKERLQQAFVFHLAQCSDGTNASFLASRAMEYFGEKHRRIVHINIPSLNHKILSAFHHDLYDENSFRNFSWSLGSGNIPSLIYNFVRTQDCFFHTREGPYVVFDTMPIQTDGLISIMVNLDWHIPRVTFQDLQFTLAVEDRYRITPNLSKTSLGAMDCPDLKIIDDDVTYTVSKSTLCLLWDPACTSFEGPVLALPPDTTQIETVLCANITTHFPCGVRFERKSRYLIKMDFSEEEGLDSESISSKMTYATGSQILAKDCDTAAHSVVFQEPTSTDSAESPFPSRRCGRTLHLVQGDTSRSSAASHIHYFQAIGQSLETAEELGYCHTYDSSEHASLSPSKRKASGRLPLTTLGRSAVDQFGNHGSEAEVKRRRLIHSEGQMLHIDDDLEWLVPPLANITPGPLGEAHSSPTAARPCWLDQCSRAKLDTPSKQFKAKRSGIKYTTFPWQTCNRHEDSVVSTPSPTSSSIDETDQSNTAHTTTLPDATLFQEEIRRNYIEFEHRSKQKAAERAYYTETIPGFDGVISPTDENDRSFERIFLEDSDTEDWEDDVDTLSEDVEVDIVGDV